MYEIPKEQFDEFASYEPNGISLICRFCFNRWVESWSDVFGGDKAS